MVCGDKDMRQRRERSVVLPFSIGCTSQSSVAVATKKSVSNTKPSATNCKEKQERKGRLRKDKVRKTVSLMALPKRNISVGIHKLMRSIRSLSHALFVYKREEEEEEEEQAEEVEIEMEIGYPTDVKHVTHIGLDGTTTTNHVKGWDALRPPEIISFPSNSSRQMELFAQPQPRALKS